MLRHCFTGERFSFHGTRYQFDDVVIRPRYVQPGGPPLWIAAMSAGGALRAARFDGHLLPQGPRDQVLEPWQEALTRVGRDPASYRVGIIRGCLVTDDRERDWPAVRAAERYRGELYSRFFAESGRFQPVERDGPRIPQTWVVGNVDHCVAELVDLHRRARHHRPRDLGRAARPAPRADERQPRTLRPRRRPPAESRERHPCMNAFRSGVAIERSR